MRRYFIALWCFIILYCNSCISMNIEKPKLVVLLVVDQMRPDLLTRFDELYKGGFKWLIDNGIWFSNTHHEHSYTATGPGHTAIGYGQYPGKIGVIGNSFYDRDLKKNVNCVEDPKAKVVGAYEGKARSTSRYDFEGLGDWLKSSYTNSKVISIAGKDRAACLLGGKNPDLPIYYNKSGSFISSDYYVDRLPKWLIDFNQNLNIEFYKDSIWDKSLKDSHYKKYSREDNYFGESDDYLNALYSPVFPIGFDRDTDPKSSIMGRPWFEREILEISKLAIEEEKLGFDLDPDLLCIGFSAMDWMIHDYGPFSQEVMDACLKLDQYLGDFINYVDDKVGLDNVLFVLTADHGGLPLPEYVNEKGGKAGRINGSHFQEALQWVDEECEERLGDKFYHRDGANFFLDMEKMKKEDINPDIVYSIVNQYITNVEGIDKIAIKDSILNDKSDNKINIRLKNMIHPHKTPEIFPIVTPGYLYRSPYGTSHGSPYDYDTHVPLIFSRKQFRSKIEKTNQATVDIAPTIAKYLGIEIPSYCDGIPIDL